MVLLGDKAKLKARFGPFGDSANVDSRLVHGLCGTYHRLRNHFGRTRWNSKVTPVMSNHVSVRLEMVLVSVTGRCMVCAIGLETILDASIVLLGDEAQVQARFGLFRYSASLDSR